MVERTWIIPFYLLKSCRLPPASLPPGVCFSAWCFTASVQSPALTSPFASSLLTHEGIWKQCCRAGRALALKSPTWWDWGLRLKGQPSVPHRRARACQSSGVDPSLLLTAFFSCLCILFEGDYPMTISLLGYLKYLDLGTHSVLPMWVAGTQALEPSLTASWGAH